MTESSETDFGDRLQSRADELGLSLNEVARRIPCDPTRIQAWKKGTAIPRGDNLLKLAEILETTAEWLKRGEKRMANPVPRAWVEFQSSEAYKQAKPWHVEALITFVEALPPTHEPTVEWLVGLLAYLRAAPRKR